MELDLDSMRLTTLKQTSIKNLIDIAHNGDDKYVIASNEMIEKMVQYV